MRKLKKMVEGLGAREFRERPFFPDPYEVLGVGSGASDEEVAAAHRKLVCVPPRLPSRPFRTTTRLALHSRTTPTAATAMTTNYSHRALPRVG